MLVASGMNFDVRRTGPHILGVTIGVLVLFSLCGFGLVVLSNEILHAELTLSIIGSIIWPIWGGVSLMS